jgi:hypothetical protein
MDEIGDVDCGICGEPVDERGECPICDEPSEVSSTGLLSENRLAAERLVWILHQPEKVAEICEHWFNWQWDELTDEELIEKIGEIIFRDYPKRVVQISDNTEVCDAQRSHD